MRQERRDASHSRNRISGLVGGIYTEVAGLIKCRGQFFDAFWQMRGKARIAKA